MRNISRRARTLAVGASLLVLAAAPALAQNDPVPNAPPPAATTESVSGSGGDIIVTAQRRSERLRDVPISITALSADTLSKAGISNTLELSRVAVGVELPLYGGFVRPSIRGISSGLSSLGDSSNVALYIDGVYQPSESGQLADMPVYNRSRS
jgi:iron complex outermembrane receptor protein